MEQQSDNKLLQPEDRYDGWELDDDAPSEVSSRWESDGSALFDSIDEGETYPIILDNLDEEEKKVDPARVEAAR